MSDNNEGEAALRSAWQTTAAELPRIGLEDIRGRAVKLQRRVRRRNAIEYAAGTVALLGFMAYIAHFSSVWLKLGSALAIAGLIFALTNLHFRASAKQADPSQSCSAFVLGELSRQRDALRSAGWWYLLPLVPGIIVFRIGVHLDLRPGLRPADVIYDFSALALFGFIVWLNRWAANRLQKQIDEVEALSEPAPAAR